MQKNLRIAIQKSGRLSEGSLELIDRSGIKVADAGKGRLKAIASNFPLELLYLRDDDIPGYVADGVADVGIVGENVWAETNTDLNLVHRLGFSKCRLSLAVEKSEEYHSIKDLEGKKIATSYPNILSNYLNKQGVNAHIHEISGSVEIAPSIGLAHAVCDIVSSGSTLFQNGLKEVEVIFQSEAIMVGGRGLQPEVQAILDQLLFRIKSIQRAKTNRYILLNAPIEKADEIISILPGMRSPTLVPLAQEGWVSLHSVIEEDAFWDKIDALKAAGAQGILVVPIEKMIL